MDNRYETPQFGENAYRAVDKYFKCRKSAGLKSRVLPTDFSPAIDLRNTHNNSQCPDADRLLEVGVINNITDSYDFKYTKDFFDTQIFEESYVNYDNSPEDPMKKAYIPDSTQLCGREHSKIYSIQNIPGLFVISRGMGYEEQLVWALRCLTSYADAPYTNLINLIHLQKSTDENEDIDEEEVTNEVEKQKELFWKSMVLWLKMKQSPSKPNTREYESSYKNLKALRWSSLGYHYNWTERCYDENVMSDFPPSLYARSQDVLEPFLTHNLVHTVSPEAAIINFYPVGSTMGAHCDDAEPANQSPIVSFMVGCTAVFTIGSPTRAHKPVSILLRSGDILIQDGPSRLAFHSVPRIVEDSAPVNALSSAANTLLSYVEKKQDSEATITLENPQVQKYFDEVVEDIAPLMTKYGVSWKDVFGYLLELLQIMRINFNCRQVIDEGETLKPSELRQHFPIDAVKSGLYIDNPNIRE